MIHKNMQVNHKLIRLAKCWLFCGEARLGVKSGRLLSPWWSGVYFLRDQARHHTIERNDEVSHKRTDEIGDGWVLG